MRGSPHRQVAAFKGGEHLGFNLGRTRIEEFRGWNALIRGSVVNDIPRHLVGQAAERLSSQPLDVDPVVWKTPCLAERSELRRQEPGRAPRWS